MTTISNLKMVISISNSFALNLRPRTYQRHAACLPRTNRPSEVCTNALNSSKSRPTMTSCKYFAASPSPPPRTPRSWRCLATPPPSWNPQNCDQPLVLPSPQFSAEEAVRVQLDALANSDQPWASHGIQLCYEFGVDIGGMDPSYYFGFPKDLYHLGEE